MRTEQYGRVTFAGDSVIVSGDGAQLYDWAHRPGAAWPCSYLARCDLVAATFDRVGDLVDLQVIVDGKDSDADDLMSDELSAWADDVRAASPFAPLMCPSCGEEVWDGPRGHKLAKCWNHHPETGGTLAFDTMDGCSVWDPEDETEHSPKEGT